MKPVFVAGLLCALFTAGCGKAATRSRRVQTTNGKTFISADANGVTRKLDAACEFSIDKGRLTALAKGGVLRLQESGGSEAREAELREKDGTKELWIKKGDTFREATAADDLWLQGFLEALGGERSMSVAGGSFVITGGNGSAPKEEILDENATVAAVLAQLKRRSFSHERQKGMVALLAKRTLEPPDQVAVVEAVFAQLDFGHEQVAVLKKLIASPNFSPEAKKAVIQRIERLPFDHEKVEVQKALLELN